MNWELIKHKFCRLAVTASLLLGGVMVSAAASGTMPLWAALLGLLLRVVMLNAVCGILLGTPAAEPRRASSRPHQPPCRTTVRCARRARCLNMPTPICCEPITAASPAQPWPRGLAVSQSLCYNGGSKRM